MVGQGSPKSCHFGSQKWNKIDKKLNQHCSCTDFSIEIGWRCFQKAWLFAGVLGRASVLKHFLKMYVLFCEYVRKSFQNVIQNRFKLVPELFENLTKKRCQFWRGPGKRLPGFPRYPVSEIWPGQEGIWEVRVVLSNTPCTFQGKVGGYIYIY